jgi:prepilin-type N-terminal cleavage/methylation domain-containing protein
VAKLPRGSRDGAHQFSRSGFTLIELIVCLAITAVLFGLVLGAVQTARNAALRTTDSNHKRQIALAILTFATAHDERLPSLDGHEDSANPIEGIFRALLPYVGCEAEWLKMRPDGITGSAPVYYFASPNDPTILTKEDAAALCRSSIAANGQLFLATPTLAGSIPDGTSNTIGLASHYGKVSYSPDHRMEFSILSFWPHKTHATAAAALASFQFCRPSFADPESDDLVPFRNYDGTIGEHARRPFQLQPLPRDADPRVPQSPFKECMIVALADGSVRAIAPNIRQAAYWALVTPNGGELDLAE